MSKNTGVYHTPRGEARVCDHCGKEFFPQGFPSHQRAIAREAAGFIPKRDRQTERATDPSRRPYKKKAISNSWLADYLKALNDGTFARANKDLNKVSRLQEKIIAAQQSGDYLSALLLTNERNQLGEAAAVLELENEFIAKGGAYSRDNKITWQTWREMMVPAHVLKMAGISQSNKPEERPEEAPLTAGDLITAVRTESEPNWREEATQDA